MHSRQVAANKTGLWAAAAEQAGVLDTANWTATAEQTEHWTATAVWALGSYTVEQAGALHSCFTKLTQSYSSKFKFVGATYFKQS